MITPIFVCNVTQAYIILSLPAGMSRWLNEKRNAAISRSHILYWKIPIGRGIHNQSKFRIHYDTRFMLQKVLKLLPIYGVVLSFFIVLGIGGSRAITVISENAPMKNRMCIVIDAGHGGIDGGAISCTGMEESKLNLQFAIKLRDLLNLLGIKTNMIRTTDCSVYTEGNTIAAQKVSDLKERVRLINQSGNDLLISLHQNYFSDSRYSGAQVFYCQNPGSKELAVELQTALVSTLNPGSNRAAKKAEGIYIFKKIQCNGILVECGFLSNPEEEARLRDPVYQKKLCAVIASVCSQYCYRSTQTAEII